MPGLRPRDGDSQIRVFSRRKAAISLDLCRHRPARTARRPQQKQFRAQEDYDPIHIPRIHCGEQRYVERDPSTMVSTRPRIVCRNLASASERNARVAYRRRRDVAQSATNARSLNLAGA